MKNNFHKENLKTIVEQVIKTKEWLERSINICNAIGIKDDYSETEYDAYENLTSRYSRTIDILINKLYRAIDSVEFEEQGSIIDTINRAERRNLIESVNSLREMKDLRNEIAHEYVTEKLDKLFKEVFDKSQELLKIVEKAIRYSQKYLKN